MNSNIDYSNYISFSKFWRKEVLARAASHEKGGLSLVTQDDVKDILDYFYLLHSENIIYREGDGRVYPLSWLHSQKMFLKEYGSPICSDWAKWMKIDSTYDEELPEEYTSDGEDKLFFPLSYLHTDGLIAGFLDGREELMVPAERGKNREEKLRDLKEDLCGIAKFMKVMPRYEITIGKRNKVLKKEMMYPGWFLHSAKLNLFFDLAYAAREAKGWVHVPRT